eukprot:3236453-Prymnesium_polylepis.1
MYQLSLSTPPWAFAPPTPFEAHLARVDHKGGEGAVAHAEQLSEERVQHHVRMAQRARRRLCKVRRPQQPQPGEHLLPRVEGNCLRVFAQQTVLSLVVEAFRVAVHVDRLPPHVGAKYEVVVVLVYRRIWQHAAVCRGTAEDVIADEHVAGGVGEALRERRVERAQESRPRVAAARLKRADACEQPGASGLVDLTRLERRRATATVDAPAVHVQLGVESLL